ncbi:hypothetical protein BKA65DRAFT_498436 [Rhexocercosporidium sp. MPI-PUGE-AT-0058]|nr:hypothetical protein BKA65DRAFT_498436 [Rhexocercosporidium sp. MPI-PUGE-AT-0058]
MSLSALWFGISRVLFSSKTKTDILPPSLSFEGQTILITGGTSGLGFETAIHYVNLGAASVIITARTLSRGNDAKFEIERRTGKKDVVHVMILDMDTFAGVQAFVKEVRATIKKIDIVLLNAGVHAFDFKLSPEGWETDTQVNTLSTILLGLLLLPWLREIKKPGQTHHLGFVGSSSHYRPDISKFPQQGVLEARNDPKNFVSGVHNYGISKLLFHYGALELAKLAVDEDGCPSPIVNIVCPGMIRTNIARDFANKGFFFKIVEAVLMFFITNPADVGARSLVLIATTTPDQHGTFRNPMLTKEEYAIVSAPMLTSPEGKRMQAQVWKEITAVLVAAVPEVADIIRS